MKIPNFIVEDMIESIDLIQVYLQDTTEEQFFRNTELQDAVIRRLMIIGEAATKITDEIRSQKPDIPWKTIVAFRNIAIHEYANVSMDKVWEIYKTELPILQNQLRTLLNILPPPPKPS